MHFPELSCGQLQTDLLFVGTAMNHESLQEQPPFSTRGIKSDRIYVPFQGSRPPPPPSRMPVAIMDCDVRPSAFLNFNRIFCDLVLFAHFKFGICVACFLFYEQIFYAFCFGFLSFYCFMILMLCFVELFLCFQTMLLVTKMAIHQQHWHQAQGLQ